MKIAILEITTWRGISIGAVHVYGELHFKELPKVKLERVLDSKGVAALNKMDRAMGREVFTKWRVGQKTDGFDTEDDVIALAIETYKDHFPKAEALVLGKPAYIEPMKPLDGPKPFVSAAKRLYKRAEKNGWWEGDEKKMEKISNEWEALIAEKKTKKARRRKK